ncbi:hypothetical protein ENUP19_0261G0001 [Entamoeba nuttalli]|uniref:Rap-GAP domain-containing protein n=1 Tax=Entamoeba nuttalli TaxID=412467 RepID=A0ABQ0DSD2_9EUKA
MSSKQKLNDIEKKLKKHKQTILDGKSEPSSRQKAILFFLENNKKEELAQIFKEHKSLLHGLFSLYPPALEGLYKKQKPLTEKDCLIVETLMDFAAENYSPSEVTFLEPINSILTTFLAVETPYPMRKSIFKSFMNILVKLNAVSEETTYPKLFIGSLNLEGFSNNITLHLTCTHIPVGTPTPIHSEINDTTKPKQQTYGLLDIFFEYLTNNPEILYPLFKELLSYICSDYCKTYCVDTFKQQTGYTNKTIPTDLLDYIIKTLLNTTLLKAITPYHNNLLQLLMYFYDISIDLDVIEHQLITKAVQLYFTNFIFNDPSFLKTENTTESQLLEFQKEIISKITKIFIKNKGNEEPEVKILIQNLIKTILLSLQQSYFNESLKIEMVKMVEEGALGFLPEKVGVQTQLLITVVVDCLFVVWIYWNKSNIEEWKELQQRLKPFLKEEMVIAEIERKFNQLTKELIDKHYHKKEITQPPLPIQLQMMKLKTVELIQFDSKIDEKETIPEDESLKQYLVNFTTTDILGLWNIFNEMFQDIDTLEPIARLNCCKVLMRTLEYLLIVDSYGETNNDFNEEGRIQLYDTFLPFLIKALKRTDNEDEKCLLYGSMCDLMIRKIPKTSSKVYGYFYQMINEVSLEDNNQVIETILIRCYNIYSVELPGSEILIPKFFKMFLAFKKVGLDGNNEMKMNQLLTTMINICFSSKEVIEQFTLEKSLYSIISEVINDGIKQMKTSTGIITFVWIIEQFIEKTIIINKTEDYNLKELVINLINLIQPNQNVNVIDNVLNAINLLRIYIPEDYVILMISMLCDIIIKKEVESQTIGTIFLTLSDFFVGGPSSFSYSLTTELIQKLVDSITIALAIKHEPNNKMGASEGADLFIETVLHHYGIFGNKGIDRISGPEETTSSAWFVVGKSRILSISKPYTITKIHIENNSEKEEELIENLLTEFPTEQQQEKKKENEIKIEVNKNEQKLCRITIRDALGRWSWDVEPIWVESSLKMGSISEVEQIKDFDWKDLMIELKEREIKETVFENDGALHNILNEMEEGYKDILTWQKDEIYDIESLNKEIELFGEERMKEEEIINTIKRDIIKEEEEIEKEHKETNPNISAFVSQIIEVNALPTIAHSIHPFEINDKFKLAIKQIDKLPLREGHKVALYYVKRNQTLLEALNNKETSEGFKSFKHALSWEFKSVAFEKGIEYYGTWRDEIIFNSLNEATMSNDVENIQEKQKQMFSSFVQVIYVEGDQGIDVSSIVTQFSNVFIILRPHQYGIVIEIYRKENIPLFGPLVTGSIVCFQEIAKLVRETVLNASRAVHNTLMADKVLRPFIQRGKAIHDLIKSNKTETNNYFDNENQIYFMNNEIINN